MKPEYLARCTALRSEDGGSCSPRVPCKLRVYSDGHFEGTGCGEPCDFVTADHEGRADAIRIRMTRGEMFDCIMRGFKAAGGRVL